MIKDLSITKEYKIIEKTLMYLRGDSVQLVGAVWLFKLFYVLVIFAIMALTLIISNYNKYFWICIEQMEK